MGKITHTKKGVCKTPHNKTAVWLFLQKAVTKML